MRKGDPKGKETLVNNPCQSVMLARIVYRVWTFFLQVITSLLVLPCFHFKFTYYNTHKNWTLIIGFHMVLLHPIKVRDRAHQGEDALRQNICRVASECD